MQDGMAINILSTLQMLSQKVKIDKVDPLYFLHPESLVDLDSKSRLSMSDPDAEEYKKLLTADLTQFEAVAFHSQCWFLTLTAHHLSIVSCLRRYNKRCKALGELQQMLDQLVTTESQWRDMPNAGQQRALMQRWQLQLKV